MGKFILVILIAVAAFWCYNNFDFSSFINKTAQSVQNEKTVKAVRGTRQFNQEHEQSVLNDNY